VGKKFIEEKFRILPTCGTQKDGAIAAASTKVFI
jgi:hypothetical protein